MSASSSYLRKLERERVGNVIPSTSRQSWRLVTKAILNGFVSKYQNRRSQILKSVNPFRSPVNISKIQTRQTIFVNNQRLRIHDIVSIIDSKDESKKYFGQIIALVTDSYAKHFVYLIWLVPKHPDESKFSPENFIHGITDERAIPADCCVFESSCPLLPRYMRTWTPEKMIEEQTRIEVAQRIQNIRVNENPTLPNIRDDFKNAI